MDSAVNASVQDAAEENAMEPDLRSLEREKLQTSKFDAVTSLFMALILFLGAFVLMMFIVWLLSGEPELRVYAEVLENAAGRADNAEGFERDFEPPGAEEVEELMEPTLQDTIEAVTDAVSSVAAALDTMNTNATASTAGTGQGDSRPPGPEGEGDDIVPRSERWQLNFSAKSISGYAAQLDFYKIELGVVGGGIQGVDYANNLAARPTARHSDDSKAEKRLYFMWQSPTPLQKFDQQLLSQAGINFAGRSQMRFIPAPLENQLANVELDYAKSKGRQKVSEIAKTIFQSKEASGGYQFEVIDQRYRN